MLVRLFSSLIFLFYFLFPAHSQYSGNDADRNWSPQEDEVYLQEISTQMPTEHPITAIIAHEKVAFALMKDRLYKIENKELLPVNNAPDGIHRLFREQNKIFAAAREGLFQYQAGQWKKKDSRKFVAACTHFGQLHMTTEDEIFKQQDDAFLTTKPVEGYLSNSITNLMEDGTQVYVTPVKLGPVSKIASYSGTIYMIRRGKLALFDGKSIDEDFIDWGHVPTGALNDLVPIGNRLFIGTSKGLGELRGAALTMIKGKDGLPVEATTCLARGFDQDLWIGTERGAVRMTKEGEFHYFGPGMWLPGMKVNAIATGEKTVYIATDRGIGIIEYEPFTLLKKADWYAKHLENYGFYRMGFVQYLYKKNEKWIREITDNDGSHTASYLAYLSYKYAVTGDKEVRKKATDAFKAMIWLNKITDHHGFIARSILSPEGDEDNLAEIGSGGLPAKWYKTPDGKWYWKGDTSSDEVISHFYAVSIYHDLIAEGKEKEVARDHLTKMATYILDCDWTMHDLDGKPTRWARWNPEYLLRPYGYMDRGVNGLEALAFMKSAFHVSGDPKFTEGYEQLIKWGYPENTIRQKNTFPPMDIAPWDDDLAFQSYYTLLRYEKDPILRSTYLRSLERTWAIKRIDRHPWFNFAYGALTGNDGEFGETVKFMREWALDTREHSYFNSHRDDLFMDPGYEAYDGTMKVFSPREIYIGLDGRHPQRMDYNRGGNRAEPPVEFLRDYWMGRYYGFIKAPETKDPTLLNAQRDYMGIPGAEPYQGPERPEVY